MNVQGKLKNCEREINMISRDKLLQKRANEKLYYDKSKDEKNEFNIFTKQMLVEQNYEYIAKHRRKLRDINKVSKKNSFENKTDKFGNRVNDKFFISIVSEALNSLLGSSKCISKTVLLFFSSILDNTLLIFFLSVLLIFIY